MSAEDVERRLHWLRYARELGQEDDFRALLDDIRREAVEDTMRRVREDAAQPDPQRYTTL